MIVGVSMVRDEADIIEATLLHLLAQGVDGLIVADNLSCDGTRLILDRLAGVVPLTVVDDDDPRYVQGEKMTRLAAMAGAVGAEWVVPFDADEHWSGTDGRRLAEVLAGSPNRVERATAVEHLPGGRRLPDAKRMGKVAFRWEPGAVIADGSHEVTVAGSRGSGRLQIAEFQYRSLAQATRKVRQGKAALEAAGLPSSTGAHWRQLGGLDDALMADWWDRYCSQPSIPA